jgi:NRAMP (natural resistance-associated macrophage protein)-like metal ion transporter
MLTPIRCLRRRTAPWSLDASTANSIGEHHIFGSLRRVRLVGNSAARYNQSLFVRGDKVPPVASQQHRSKLSPPDEKANVRALLLKLGPGLITGASDDDPSGIATYSQAGAQFGFGTLWIALFSYPLMCAIQEISARIGRVTGAGIAASLRKHYPRPIVFLIVVLVLIANTFNLGADIGAMGDAVHLLVGGPAWIYLLALGALSLSLQIFIPYKRYVNYLKWLTLSLFAYVITAFVVHLSWLKVLHDTFLPPLHSFGADYFTVAIAFLGTTISPYLFFWQASEEAEDVRDNAAQRSLHKAPEQAPEQLHRIKIDTYLGMAFSNLVAFFIVVTTAATLHAHGDYDIQTATQAAAALQPLAGRFAFLLFSAGIVGTGLLAIPVLAGSAAYALGEAMRWRVSMEAKPRKAPKFYATIAVATVIGLALNFMRFNPMKALFWSAVVNGVAAVPIMLMMMLLTRRRKVMGEFTLPLYLEIIGWIATLVMLFASIGMFATIHL